MASFLDMFKRFVPTWSEILNKPATFPTGAHSASHENAGADEISVTSLSGLLADPQDAGKIKGVTINDAAKADQFCLVFDSGTNRIIYVELPSG
jgi:hypothetical protein